MTNEVKFTPGPWTKDKHGQLRSPEGKQVVVWGAGLAWGNRDDEAEANGLLIAAAPDLLECLKEARSKLSDQSQIDLAYIDSVISKATA